MKLEIKIKQDLSDLISFWYIFKFKKLEIKSKEITEKQKKIISDFLNKFNIKYKINNNKISIDINKNKRWLFKNQRIKIIIRVIQEILSNNIDEEDDFKIRMGHLIIDTNKFLNIETIKDVSITYSFENFINAFSCFQYDFLIFSDIKINTSLNSNIEVILKENKLWGERNEK